MDGYDGGTVALRHPVDQEIRERLRKAAPNQADFANAIGRSQGWLNKYMNGAGTATIDDVIRIAAMMIGASAPSLTDEERRLLRAWNQIPEESRDNAVEFFENHARFLRRGQPRGASATKAQKSPAKSRKSRGTPRAAEQD